MYTILSWGAIVLGCTFAGLAIYAEIRKPGKIGMWIMVGCFIVSFIVAFAIDLIERGIIT